MHCHMIDVFSISHIFSESGSLFCSPINSDLTSDVLIVSDDEEVTPVCPSDKKSFALLLLVRYYKSSCQSKAPLPHEYKRVVKRPIDDELVLPRLASE